TLRRAVDHDRGAGMPRGGGPDDDAVRVRATRTELPDTDRYEERCRERAAERPLRARRPAGRRGGPRGFRRVDGPDDTRPEAGPVRFGHADVLLEEGPEGTAPAEARLGGPAAARLGVVVRHPHPLYGGDMDSPVVARIVESCAGRGLATLRFNFRGVGASTGRHDEGRGEQDDVRASLARLQDALGSDGRVALAGYSFGAAVAAAVAATAPVAGLALVAPPLRVTDVHLPVGVDGPVLVVAGAEDQYCPAD